MRSKYTRGQLVSAVIVALMMSPLVLPIAVFWNGIKATYKNVTDSWKDWKMQYGIAVLYER